MSIDTPTKSLDWRATAVVNTRQETTWLLDELSAQWPDYQPVTHKALGTYGVVREDSPANVPGLFDGKPRRVCLGDDGPLVSVVWNPGGCVPLRCWVPAAVLKPCGRRY
ncbi:hypothetical protein [Streptomyces sp. G1]|uniref:hypothetical protein n=1 Tax=Streptomyces sp. G1 TaxID=361572 RepID=UPI00202FB245|nr:hypothetical protein [Streptomyces sp. G1]MCM1977191.1 hypothetical protein [Streptomyces sp. G1]